jgi:hypothetical protein
MKNEPTLFFEDDGLCPAGNAVAQEYSRKFEARHANR